MSAILIVQYKNIWAPAVSYVTGAQNVLSKSAVNKKGCRLCVDNNRTKK